MADEDGDKPADATSGAPATPAGPAETRPSDAASSDAASSDAAPSDESTRGDATDTALSPPKKKRKKKKKRPAQPSEADEQDKPAGPVLNAEGWERPGFVLDFPKHPELDRLVRAFELGNYAFVRENARKLAESASDTEIRRAANELLRRIEPDPLVKLLFAMAVGLFLFMLFYAYRSHGH